MNATARVNGMTVRPRMPSLDLGDARIAAMQLEAVRGMSDVVIRQGQGELIVHGRFFSPDPRRFDEVKCLVDLVRHAHPDVHFVIATPAP